MLISVIIPTYNREQLLKETIDSILNQTFTDFELIIVDNYSTDNTEKIVKSYNDERIQYFKNKNGGIVAVNRNYGIKKAKGKYIAFCDDDDLWISEKLERQIKEFEKDENIGLVCTNGYSFDKNGIRKKMRKSNDSYLNFEQLLYGKSIISCSVIVKKTALENVGIFEEKKEVLTGEDYELWLRIAKKYKIKYIGTPLIKYRIHPGSFQSTFIDGIKPLEVKKKVYKTLLDKNIIKKDTYNKACNYVDIMILKERIILSDKKVNLKIVKNTKMCIIKKIKLTLLYLLSKIRIIKVLRKRQ